MNFDVTARNSASPEFRDLADDVERLEAKLRRLDGMTVEPKARLDTKPAQRETTRFATQLKGSIQRAIRDIPALDLDTVRAQARVASLKRRIEELRGARLDIEVNTGNAATEIGAIGRELRQLRDTRVKLEVRTGASRADVSAIAQAMRQLRDTSVQLDIRTGPSAGRVDSLHGKMLALKALSPLKLQVELDDRATPGMGAIRAAAAEIARLRPTIQATADTAGAAAALAALLAQVRSLSNADHTVRVRLEQTSFLGQLARIQTELNTLAGGSVEIDADTRRLMEALALARTELAALEAMNPSVEVEADTALARWRIEELERELARIAGEQYTADVDVDVDQAALNRLAQLGTTLSKIGVAGGVAAAGATTATTAIAGLAAGLASVAGTAPLAVGALVGIGAVQATVAAGTIGLGDAFKALADGKMDKYAEALEKMSPAGRAFAESVREQKTAFDGVRMDVQQRLLAGYGDETRRLSDVLLPSVRSGLGGVADELNLTGKELAGFATSGEGVARIDSMFASTRTTVANLRPAVTDVTAAMFDVGEVGSSVLADITSGAGGATQQFREFIAQARESGQLEVWIRGGITMLQQFGATAGNVGGAVGAVFTAARDSGAGFLATAERATGAVEDFLRSTDGQETLKSFFREVRDTVDELHPGVEALGFAAADTIAEFSNTEGLAQFAGGTSAAAVAVADLLPMLGTLGGETLGDLGDGLAVASTLVSPLVAGIVWLVEALGPVAPAVTAAAVAFVAMGAARAAVLALAASMAAAATTAGAYTLGLTGSAAAGQAVATAGTRVAGVVGTVGRALPLAAVAAVGLGLAFDALGSKSDEMATKVLDGSLSMQQAIAAEAAQLDAATLHWDEGAAVAGEYAQAQRNVTAEMEMQRAAMSPYQQLQSDVARSQTALNDAVAQYTVNSPQARDAAAALAEAQRLLQGATDGAKTLTQDHTTAILDQQRALWAANDVDLQYRDSIDRIAEAQTRAAAAARDHGAGSMEAAAAAREVLRANMDAAAAAGSKAEADAKATGASNAAEIGARAHKDELIRLGNQATGPTRDALLAMANGTDLTARAASTAEIQARLHKDELQRLASQATGPLAGAMATARANFDTLGGANATAEQKAKAQKDELQRLANMASGPLRTELQRMADQIRTLPNGNVTVTATGRLGPIGSDQANPAAVGPGTTRRATGGVLPGYTPGRDVHSFASPTGGRLLLSGGEAVMRPEWTQAMTPAYVNAANAAARRGGVGGVQKFMARTAPRGGEGRAGDGSAFATGGIIGHARAPQRLASGGLVRTPPPYPVLAHQAFIQARDAMAAKLTPIMMERVRAEQARRAAAASGGGAASGPVTQSAAGALNWARSQAGKPYVWGGVGPRGYDCCLVGDTRVYGPDGATPISEVRAGHRVFSHVDDQVQVHTVTAAWQSETQPVFRVRTRNRSVVGSANHPFLVLRATAPASHVKGGRRGEQRPAEYGVAWSRLDELKRGDLVVQPREMAAHEKPAPELADGTPVDADIAWLIGAVVGDGTVTERGLRLALYGEKRDRAADIIAGCWGSHPTYREDSGLVVSSIVLHHALVELGMRCLGPDKRVPDDVWTWPVELRRAFLDGYCDADGHRPKDPRRHGERTYSSASRRLLADVRAMHMMLGDPVSNVTTNQRAKPIVIRGKTVQTALPLHTFAVWRGPGRGEAALRRRSAGLAAWLDAADFTVAQVLEVRGEGVQDTYDIEVAGAHNFVADGVVVHNSGFMSGIVNVMRGRNPHSRVGATGSFPWPGFRPGIGPGLNIGSFRGSPGHMAGTIGGVNVESSGSVGVRVGGGARGAGHSMFNTRAHLFDRGGTLRHGQVGVNLSGRDERVLSPAETAEYNNRIVQVKYGSVTEPQWWRLRDMGYKGRPDDGVEALYVPASVLRQVTAPPAPAPTQTRLPSAATPAVRTAGPTIDVERQIRAAMDQFRAALGARTTAQLNDSRLVAELRGVRGEVARSGSWPALLGELRALRTDVRTLRGSQPAALAAQARRGEALMGALR